MIEQHLDTRGYVAITIANALREAGYLKEDSE